MGKALAAQRRRRRTSVCSACFEDVAAAFDRDATSAPFDSRPYPLRIRPDVEGSSGEIAPSIDLTRLRLFFRRRPVSAIDVDAGRAYTLQREQAGAPPGTINEELKTLARLLTFAVRGGLLQQCPAFEFLRDTARQERQLRERELIMRPPVATRGEPVGRGTPVIYAPAAKRKGIAGSPLSPALLGQHMKESPKDQQHPHRSLAWRARELTKTEGRPISLDMVKRANRTLRALAPAQ